MKFKKGTIPGVIVVFVILAILILINAYNNHPGINPNDNIKVEIEPSSIKTMNEQQSTTITISITGINSTIQQKPSYNVSLTSPNKDYVSFFDSSNNPVINILIYSNELKKEDTKLTGSFKVIAKKDSWQDEYTATVKITVIDSITGKQQDTVKKLKVTVV